MSGEVWAADLGTRLAKLRYFRSLGVLEMVDSGAIVPDNQLEPLRERARDRRGKAVTLGLSPGKETAPQWFGRIVEAHLGIRICRGLNAISAEFRSPETDPLFDFVALRLSWKLEWESNAEIPREEVHQTHTPQGVEVHTTQLNLTNTDSSGWYSTQTHTPQGVEPVSSGEFLQPKNQPETEPSEPIPANQ
ncbi:hypothetical protein HCU40_19525 (plasmid) [Pseudanabaena biceps]|nr:hypothetical protein [Pseudanabaena biceps]